jgi:hypothetical protein
MDSMENEEYTSDQDTHQDPEQDKHFASRRKILAGLAGVPVLVTFAPNANAQAVTSFGRCVANATQLQDPAQFRNWFQSQVRTNGTWVNQQGVFFSAKTNGTNGSCSGTRVDLSSACLQSFASSGGQVPTAPNVCRNRNP